jgi:hypothetical protein
MDRTAIAAIIIGFGATVAAMVMPQKYPQAPKWAVNLSWWGGALLIVAGAIVLMTEITFSDLGDVARVWSGWLWGHVIWLLWQPAFWVVAAFVAGIAVHRWYSTLWRALPRLGAAGPQVPKWFTPLEAAERFVKPEIMAADRAAQEKAKQFRQTVKSLEAKLAGKLEPKKASSLREQLAIEIKNRDDAEYAAARRRTDVIETMSITLKMGLLVGKGCKSVKKRGEWIKDKEKNIPMNFWGITINKTDVLDLDKQTATGYLGHYDEVFIGKNENWKEPMTSSG